MARTRNKRSNKKQASLSASASSNNQSEDLSAVAPNLNADYYQTELILKKQDATVSTPLSSSEIILKMKEGENDLSILWKSTKEMNLLKDSPIPKFGINFDIDETLLVVKDCREDMENDCQIFFHRNIQEWNNFNATDSFQNIHWIELPHRKAKVLHQGDCLLFSWKAGDNNNETIQYLCIFNLSSTKQSPEEEEDGVSRDSEETETLVIGSTQEYSNDTILTKKSLGEREEEAEEEEPQTQVFFVKEELPAPSIACQNNKVAPMNTIQEDDSSNTTAGSDLIEILKEEGSEEATAAFFTANSGSSSLKDQLPSQEQDPKGLFRSDLSPIQRPETPSSIATPTQNNVNSKKKTQLLPLQSKQPKYKVHSLVLVEPRSWAGINKPGGVAKIISVVENPDGFAYNVALVMGGKQQVDEPYIKEYVQESKMEERSSRRGGRGTKVSIAAPNDNDEEGNHKEEKKVISRPKRGRKKKEEAVEEKEEIQNTHQLKVKKEAQNKVEKGTEKLDSSKMGKEQKVEYNENENPKESKRSTRKKVDDKGKENSNEMKRKTKKENDKPKSSLKRKRNSKMKASDLPEKEETPSLTPRKRRKGETSIKGEDVGKFIEKSKEEPNEITPPIRLLITKVTITPRMKKCIEAMPNTTLIEDIKQAKNATHVIACENKATQLLRSTKLMIGLNVTSNILYGTWLTIGRGKVDTLKKYIIINDKKAELRYKCNLKETYQNFSIMKSKNQIGILEGYHIYFSKFLKRDNLPPLNEMELIVESAKGIVIKSLTKCTMSSKVFILGNEDAKTEEIKELTQKGYSQEINLRSVRWLFQCVMNQKLINLEGM